MPHYRNEAAAARLILGTRSSAPLHERRVAAARQLGMELDTMLHRRRGVRTHEERVVAQVADVIWERETACVLGVVFAELQERTPEGSDLAVELLHQYRHYYRIWTALDGLRADVAAVLQIRRQGEDEVNKLDDYVRSSLHWYARCQQLVRRFVDDYGGEWLFSDEDIEVSVRDAIKFVENFSRLTYRQDSQLRVLVDRTTRSSIPSYGRLRPRRRAQKSSRPGNATWTSATATWSTLERLQGPSPDDRLPVLHRRH